MLWCISVNGHSFGDWGMSCVDLVRIGVQGFYIPVLLGHSLKERCEYMLCAEKLYVTLNL